MNAAEDVISFYRALKSNVIEGVRKAGSFEKLYVDSLDDSSGNQLIISTKDRRDELAILNFRGTQPSVLIGTMPLQLQVIGPNDVVALGLRDSLQGVGDRHFTAEELGNSIVQRIADRLKCIEATKIQGHPSAAKAPSLLDSEGHD